ncbi:MAG TPA: mandelate racemase/muconate lactonizing enzyme family protein [Candidatus Latescibacteria bacterium]|jgi:L-alanine-DL-glutamate epimerase-like enolase superfamily enzyme|nr:mandelate racemase/muconate lactonizing enzyme family protein [Candidatus Latescibacterota bacterium]HJP31860.1 mandelate racemase/muconate lactonizing enzyme family protein [Candidatus Latescibacterota bacterium]
MPAHTIDDLRQRIGHQDLRITEVRAVPLSYRPADGSNVHICGPVVLNRMDAGFVEVHTDQGIRGLGPAVGRFDDDHARLIGTNPFDILDMDVHPGIDMACWDIIGLALDTPVCELLAIDGTANREVPVYASGGVMWTYYDRGDGQPFGVDELIEEALDYQSQGFSVFKWRPGTDWEEAGITPRKLGEICHKLRDAVGPDFDLGLEKKGYDSWTLDECLEIAPIISELGFLFFEQPMGDVGPAQFEDYRRLKKQMPGVMLWGGESFRSAEQARPWIEAGIYDAIQADCVHLGITENWRLAQICAAHGTRTVPHNWHFSLGTVCNSHLVAGVASGHMCEFFMYPNDMRYGLLQEPPRPINGVLHLFDTPGLGARLIDDAAHVFSRVQDQGQSVTANPRFPHAWERARRRETEVAGKYADG